MHWPLLASFAVVWGFWRDTPRMEAVPVVGLLSTQARKFALRQGFLPLPVLWPAERVWSEGTHWRRNRVLPGGLQTLSAEPLPCLCRTFWWVISGTSRRHLGCNLKITYYYSIQAGFFVHFQKPYLAQKLRKKTKEIENWSRKTEITGCLT